MQVKVVVDDIKLSLHTLLFAAATLITSNIASTLCPGVELNLTCIGQGGSQRWTIMKDGLSRQCTLVSGEQSGMLCVLVIPDAGIYNLSIQLHSSGRQRIVSALSTVTNVSLNNTVIECTTGGSSDMTIIKISKGTST